MTRALDDATAELLAGSLREVLAGSTALGPALRELGWADVLADDPARATTLLFTEHGRALATSRALDDVVLAELEPVLPAGPDGTIDRAVLYPGGLLLGPLDGVAEVVVPVGSALHLIAADRVAAAARPAAGFDPGSGWLQVSPPPTGPAIPAADAWPRAVAAGRRALAAEIVGVCAAALELATAHTTSRVQYGRPIATFQAVRHRLAEAHVAVEAARSSLDAAWSARDAADGGIRAALLAKLAAGRAQREVMRHAVQVCGAMGLSAEGPLHRFVTRAAALDLLLDGHLELAARLGADLLAGADLDPVVGI
jgi:Acyl-CoA dehydrogenase, C-terminal domain